MVSELHAIRIYHASCQDQEPHDHIGALVSSYLQIRHRMQTAIVHYSWFDRSLFIVGRETIDPIHRSWILEHIVTPELRRALTDVWAANQVKGQRLLVAELREILSRYETMGTDSPE